MENEEFMNKIKTMVKEEEALVLNDLLKEENLYSCNYIDQIIKENQDISICKEIAWYNILKQKSVCVNRLHTLITQQQWNELKPFLQIYKNRQVKQRQEKGRERGLLRKGMRKKITLNNSTIHNPENIPVTKDQFNQLSKKVDLLLNTMFEKNKILLLKKTD